VSQADSWLDLGAWVRIARSNRAASLVALGLVLGMLALVGPWFSIDVFTSGAHDPVVDFTTTSYVTRDNEGPYFVIPYDSAACRCATMAGTFNLVLASVAIALLLGAGTAVAFLRGWVKHDMRVALASLSGILLLVAPILLAVSLPGAMAADDRNLAPGSDDDNWQRIFIGQNTSITTQTLSWGPSWAWVLSLLGGGVILAGVAVSRKEARPRAPTSYSPQAAMAPAAAPSVPPAGPDPSSGGAFPAPTMGGDQPSRDGN